MGSFDWIIHPFAAWTFEKYCGGNVAGKGCTKTPTDKSVLNIWIGLPNENVGHLMCARRLEEKIAYTALSENLK